MKIRVVVLVACAAMALAGCAGTDAGYARQSRYAPVQIENDMDYVRAVESVARQRGVEVHWVHPPRKVVPVERN